MYTNELRRARREGRRHRIRTRVFGTAQRPRLAVFRSVTNIYAQIIDDERGVTLVEASSRNKALRGEIKYGGNVTAAKVVGRVLAERAKAKQIAEVCFDRSGYKFHGRIKGLAEAAREAGLKF